MLDNPMTLMGAIHNVLLALELGFGWSGGCWLWNRLVTPLWRKRAQP